ncbi:hypothetical protein [Rhizobium sp. NPDC090279]|uniref:hypothetical protein n=1 Tax=Rhizobium sp. NPDC090279 TaxID=3364499 RepID=UPI00383A0CC9
MKTLLYGLHSIAAQRGDGLRPEFLELATLMPAWPVGHAKPERVSSNDENGKLGLEQGDDSAATGKRRAVCSHQVPASSGS